MRLIDADKLMDALRGNVLVDVTPEIEKTISGQPTAYDVGWVKRQLEGMRDRTIKNIELNSQEGDLHQEIMDEKRFYEMLINVVEGGRTDGQSETNPF